MCSTEKCVDEHRRQKVYLKPEHLRLKLQDDEEIGAATLGWLDAHGFSGSQARPRPLPPPAPAAVPTHPAFSSSSARARALVLLAYMLHIEKQK